MINIPMARRIVIILGTIGFILTLYPIWMFIDTGRPILIIPFVLADVLYVWRIWANLKEIRELERDQGSQ